MTVVQTVEGRDSGNQRMCYRAAVLNFLHSTVTVVGANYWLKPPADTSTAHTPATTMKIVQS